VRELIASRDQYGKFDWIVPGLLEHTERVVFTGSEGSGKTEFLTQWACCLAAGIHPLTGLPFADQGVRVLHIDCENNTRQATRRYERIASIIDLYDPPTPDWQDRLHFEARPEGISIAGADRTWWEATCAAASPDVIITGPAYQMGLGNPNDERDVLAFVQVLNKTRYRHNAALMLEAHPGHGKDPDGKRFMRPSGSSLWLRWPEVGIGIRRSDQDRGQQRPTHVDLVAWRSPREKRAWPRQMRNGADGLLPWEPDDMDYMAGAA
jgi:RecA-family ATPase